MKIKEKEQAIKLRIKGGSVKEISRQLKVAQSSVSLWVRNIILSSNAKERLLRRINQAQFISAERKKAKTLVFNNLLRKQARKEVSLIHFSENLKKVLCSLLYWCEGAKNYRNGIAFTNSDPALCCFFMNLLSKSFGANRSRFVVRLHLHQYHNPIRQRAYWANILGLSLSQFRPDYLKPNSGKNIREGYPGCASIRYHDSVLARKVLFFAETCIQKGA